MNLAVLLGNLTKDPEMRTLNDGTPVARFTVACQRRFKNKQTGKYEADFIPCSAFGPKAEFVGKYFTKGKPIVIQGRIEVSTYERNGETRWATEVRVENADFAGSKSDGSSGGSGSSNGSNASGGTYAKSDPDDPFAGDVVEDFQPLAEDELPF